MLRIYSVVVPTYRHSEFLEATLNDISQQTYVKTEIIIVIDGPDPESLKIAKQFQEKDERITVINKKKKFGVNNALPTGVAKTSGEFLVFVSSDDWRHSKIF